jgi:hypothetical protein
MDTHVLLGIALAIVPSVIGVALAFVLHAL